MSTPLEPHAPAGTRAAELAGALRRALSPEGAAWIPVAAAHVAVLTTWTYVQAIDTAASAFPERAIGPAILHGIDPTRRLPAFFNAVVIFTCCFLGTLALGRHAWRWATARLGPPPAVERHARLLAGTFGAGLFLTGTDLLLLRTEWDCGPWLLALGVAAVLALLICAALRWRPPPSLAAALGVVPFAGWFGWQIARAAPISLELTSFAALLCAALVLLAAAGLASRRRSPEALWRLARRLELGLTPLFLVPLAPVLGSELAWRQTQSRRVPVTGADGALAVALVAIALGVALFLAFPLLTRRWPGALARAGRWLPPFVWAPLVVAAANLFSQWAPTRDIPSDMLHVGNLLVPTQQLLEFGQLPFVDVWYARGLKDLLPSLLYRALHGPAGLLDPYVWEASWNTTVRVVVVYLALRQVTSTWVGAVLAIFLPVFDSFLEGYYVFALVPALVAVWVARAPSMRRMVLLWLSLLLAFAWMPTTAMGAAPGVVAIAALLWLRDPRWSPRLLARSFAWVFGVAFVAYAVLVVLKGHSLADTFRLISVFSKADRLVGSYEVIYRGESKLLILTQYGLYPLIGVAGGLLGSWYLLTAPRVTPAMLLLTITSAGGLAIFTRAFHRHCLGEAFQPSFLIFVACLIPLVALSRRALAGWLCGAVALWFCTFILSPQRPAMKAGPWLTMPAWSVGQERVAMNPHDKARVAAFKGWMDANLAPSQTFADLTNAHLLYTLANRRFPFFHHATQLIQLEAPQQVYVKQWKELLAKGELPAVVFRSGFFGSNLDGVWSSQSLFLISELVYQRYDPAGQVWDFELWKARAAPLNLEQGARGGPAPGSAAVVRQSYDFKWIPHAWGSFDAKEAATRSEEVAGLVSALTLLAPGQQLDLDVPPGARRAEGNYLHFKLQSAGQTQLRVVVSDRASDELGDASFNVKASLKPEDYLLRVSTLAAWYRSARPAVRVINVGGSQVALSTLLVRKGD